ncbi:PH domain-containing protein [Shimazuella sp. AN120528]|uniref:PH domain-containing protein n=1 Tax=Shimazuella soli TaxID=1892854 RepID=UPI001F0E3410|nr:PH domain-containing protein [Shimazuella soli]MCH5586453.1 PH domain-containing protein [Shimazuella soli]
MFGKVAADVLGLSNVGTVIKPADYDKVDSDDYVMHEDGEKIFFLIKSKSDEYCFTNKALIHLDGTSAVSKKRTLYRYDYYQNHISNVSLETAGTVDLDVELKFKLGSELYSIDVQKKQLEDVKDLYKALIKIAEITKDNASYLQFSEQSLNIASTTLSRITSAESNVVNQFKELNEFAFTWLKEKKQTYVVKDFGFVFEKYINN